MSRGNKHTKAAKPFIFKLREQRCSDLTPLFISLWRHQLQFLPFYSSRRFGPFPRWPRILGVLPPLGLGVWIPGRTAHSGISPPNKSRPPASGAAGLCAARFAFCFFLKLILWLRLTEKKLRGWRWEQVEVWRERECGIFQCCVIKMSSCFSINPTDDYRIQENTPKDLR